MLVVFGATFLAYFPALRGGFIWDDDGHVTKPALQSLHGLWRVWFEVGATQQYYPVLHSAFWLEHRLWGDATIGYHLVNVACHAASACLFAVILRRLFGSVFRGSEWLAALLFALHPVAVESVAWISEQKNTLSTLFYLLAALAYLDFDRKRGQASEIDAARSRIDFRGLTPCYLLASSLFVLAVLSKTVAATLPAALLVVFWCRRGSLSWRRDALPLLPWFAFGAAAGAFTAWVERRFIGAQGTEFALGWVERCLLAGRVIGFYLGKLFWPSGLIFIYPRWRVSAGDARQYLFPLAVAALLAALWFLRNRWRGPLAAFLFFGGSLFPALGFVDVYPFRYSYVADHFQYLASLGVIALVVAGWSGWAARGRVAVAAVILAGFGFLTWNQSRMYADIDTLYRTTLARNPGCWLAHNNLAGRLVASGRLDEAIGHYAEALRLDPRYPEAYDNLGIALALAGRREEAVANFEGALRLRPDFAEAHYNLGLTLVSAGRLPEAVEHYRAALRLSPNHAEIENNLGVALARLGQPLDAIEHYEQALRLRPGNPDMLANLGNALRMVGRYGEAIRDLRQALQEEPDSVEAHYNLGLALAAAGRRGEAEAEFSEAVRLRPDLARPQPPVAP